MHQLASGYSVASISAAAKPLTFGPNGYKNTGAPAARAADETVLTMRFSAFQGWIVLSSAQSGLPA